MKKILIILMVLFLIINEYTNSQIRRVLFENFTGTWCGWDTDGFVIMDSIIEKYPDRVIGTRIHSKDSMAIADGDSLQEFLGISGYPQALIDRIKNQGSTVLDRAIWKIACDSALNVKPKIDIQIVDSYGGTQKIKIDIIISILDTIKLPMKYHIYICEDSVSGTGTGWDQHNYTANRLGWENHPYYSKPAKIIGFQHMNVVRKIVGGIDGFPVNNPVPTLPYKEYQTSCVLDYDDKWNLKNILIVAFIHVDSTNYYEVLNTASSRDKDRRYYDSLALVALYNSTNGANWINNTNWLTNEPIDNWYGVTVQNDRVTQITLNRNKLIGVLPPEIGYLTELKELVMVNWPLTDYSEKINRIQGNLPKEIVSLKKLESILFLGNELTGELPPELWTLTNLRSINFSLNYLTGTIPKEIANLKLLRRFFIAYNQLSGSLPSEIGTLTNLTGFSVGANNFTGIIPEELYNLKLLDTLSLGMNNFEGDISMSIQKLTNLTYLYLNNCRFTSLPELKPQRLMDSLLIENNRLEFDDIEVNFYKSRRITYDPQDSVGKEKIDSIENGSSYTFDIKVGGANNRYQWFKDSIPISILSNSSYFTIDSISLSDSGSYYCHITNLMAIKLTLYSRKIELRIKEKAISTATLHVGSDSAKAGEIVEIPIYLRNASNLEFSKVENFTTDLVFNSTLLAPVDYAEKNIINGQRRITLTLPKEPISDSTLSRIKFIVALGNSESSELRLENFTAIGENVIIDTISGTFKLIGICKEGGDRLVNSDVGNLNLMIIAPNPGDEEIEIEYELIEEGLTQIDIYNYQGLIVKNVLKKVMNPGKYTQKLELGDLPQGTYFIILKTPGYRLPKIFVKVE